MAKPVRKSEKKRRSLRDDNLPLRKKNFLILGIGVAVIVIGYLAMSQGPVEGMLPLVVAPILLVAGYCVIIPFVILYHPRQKAEPSVPAVQPPPTPPSS